MPLLHDLDFLVRDAPFVPPGHSHSFLRGLHAGLAGDWLVAAHLLVPRLENAIRHVLESSGADVSNLYSDLTQPVKILGGLFAHPAMERLFGASYRFELRGHLNEKTGYDFRNRLAHGLANDAECYYSAAPINLWWLALRLCLEVRVAANE